ncbi:MAG: hypothetical protein P8Y00_06410, partial [Deltaproteobacteria bacterium]
LNAGRVHLGIQRWPWQAAQETGPTSLFSEYVPPANQPMYSWSRPSFHALQSFPKPLTTLKRNLTRFVLCFKEKSFLSSGLPWN